MTRTFRIAVVNSHPIQYFAPLYAFLNRDPFLEVTALYCSDFSLRGAIDPGFKHSVTWDVDLLTGYRSVFLGKAAKQRTPRGFWSLVCPQAWSEIRSGHYDAVLLHGYNYAVNILALLAAKTKNLPVLMRSETQLGLHRQGWKHYIRDTVLSVAYRIVDGFLAIGTANRAYYRTLGIPDEKIFDVPYTVDNERFIVAAALAPEQRAEVREKYGLPIDRPVVLYASKFMCRKHPDDVVRAMARLRDDGLTATLFMVGSGEMEHELRDLTASLDLHNVVFGGFINQAELPKVYAASDIFLLPSSGDQWGLIVNQVIAAALPATARYETGAAPDLVQGKGTGMIYRCGDVVALASALEALLQSETLRREMGERARHLIRAWSVEACALGTVSAVRHLVRA